MVWLSASSAARYVDVHPDTIARRALPWGDVIVQGKIRYRILKLADYSRAERRYFFGDLDALLIPSRAECHGSNDCRSVTEQLSEWDTGSSGPSDRYESGDNYQESPRAVYTWLSLSGAADYLDVHPTTILRHAHPWEDRAIQYRVRWRYFHLSGSRRQDRRYWVEDLEALLVNTTKFFRCTRDEQKGGERSV